MPRLRYENCGMQICSPRGCIRLTRKRRVWENCIFGRGASCCGQRKQCRTARTTTGWHSALTSRSRGNANRGWSASERSRRGKGRSSRRPGLFYRAVVVVPAVVLLYGPETRGFTAPMPVAMEECGRVGFTQRASVDGTKERRLARIGPRRYGRGK